MNLNINHQTYLDQAIDMKPKLDRIFQLLEKYSDIIQRDNIPKAIIFGKLNRNIDYLKDECDNLIEGLMTKISIISHEFNKRILVLAFFLKVKLYGDGAEGLCPITERPQKEKKELEQPSEIYLKRRVSKALEENKLIIDGISERICKLNDIIEPTQQMSICENNEAMQDFRKLVCKEVMKVIMDLNLLSMKIIQIIKDLSCGNKKVIIDIDEYVDMIAEYLEQNLDKFPDICNIKVANNINYQYASRLIDLSSFPLYSEKPVNGFNKNIISINLPLIYSKNPDQKGDLLPELRCKKCRSFLNQFTNYSGVNWVCLFCGVNNPRPKLDVTYTDVEFTKPDTISNVLNPTEKVIVFCIDVSGSMSGKRLEIVKKTCINSLRMISQTRPDYKVALVTFSNETYFYGHGDVEIKERLTPENFLRESQESRDKIRKSLSSLLPIRDSLRTLESRINKFKGNGGTIIQPALAESVVLASALSGGEIILCTDGVAADKDTVFYKSIVDYSKNNSQVRINIISFDDYDCDLQSLGILSSGTGGKIYTTPTEYETLQEILTNLVDSAINRIVGGLVKVKLYYSSENIEINNIDDDYDKNHEILSEIFISNQNKLDNEDEMVFQAVIEQADGGLRVITEKFEKPERHENPFILHAYTLRKLSKLVLQGNNRIDEAIRLAQEFSKFLKINSQTLDNSTDSVRMILNMFGGGSRISGKLTDEQARLLNNNLGILSKNLSVKISKNHNNNKNNNNNGSLLNIKEILKKSLYLYKKNKNLDNIKDEDITEFKKELEENIKDSTLEKLIEKAIGDKGSIKNFIILELVKMLISIQRQTQSLNNFIFRLSDFKTDNRESTLSSSNDDFDMCLLFSEIDDAYTSMKLNENSKFIVIKNTEKLDSLLSGNITGLIMNPENDVDGQTSEVLNECINHIIMKIEPQISKT